MTSDPLSTDPDDLWVTTITGRREPVILNGQVVGHPVVTLDNVVIAVLPVKSPWNPVRECCP